MHPEIKKLIFTVFLVEHRKISGPWEVTLATFSEHEARQWLRQGEINADITGYDHRLRIFNLDIDAETLQPVPATLSHVSTGELADGNRERNQGSLAQEEIQLPVCLACGSDRVVHRKDCKFYSANDERVERELSKPAPSAAPQGHSWSRWDVFVRDNASAGKFDVITAKLRELECAASAPQTGAAGMEAHHDLLLLIDLFEAHCENIGEHLEDEDLGIYENIKERARLRSARAARGEEKVKREPETVKYIERIGHGAPTMRGVLVSVLHGRFLSGETIAEIADDYDLLPVEVERAIQHHERVLQAHSQTRTLSQKE